MRTEQDMLLLSLRPRFASALLSGSKTVELRRQVPLVAQGAIVLLYSSSPVMAITGIGYVVDTDLGTPENLWQAHESKVGVSRNEFDDYFSGRDCVGALILSGVLPLPDPVSLAVLREKLAIEPPQSFRYLGRTQVNLLFADSTENTDVLSGVSAVASKLRDATSTDACALF